MFYREFKSNDLGEIISLKRNNYGDEFPLPDPRKNAVTSMVIEEDNKIIAFGVVKLFADTSMVMNQSLTDRKKVAILHQLMTHAIIDTKAYGLEVLNVFSKREDFLEVLKKHYGFADNFKAISLNLGS